MEQSITPKGSSFAPWMALDSSWNEEEASRSVKSSTVIGGPSSPSARTVSVPTVTAIRAANIKRPAVGRLDQYYTRPDVAAHLYGIFRERFDPTDHQMVEPSAGAGAFSRLLPAGSLAFDIDPRYPGIVRADFLTVELNSSPPVAIIGNPPFGKNASMAVRFFNHAAPWSSVIALILPRTFRKASVVNRLDRAFHLVHEQFVPDDAFLFEGKPYHVPAVCESACNVDPVRG